MVHQTYVQRLVLGRSAREPPLQLPDRTQEQDGPEGEYVQRFDSRGYPEHTESRQLARRLRRAQNDILTTIGVCVCDNDQPDPKANTSTAPGASKFEQEQARINIDEHSNSFWFEVVAGLGLSVFPEWAINTRRRIQTFDFYLEVPLWVVVQSEFKHLDLWSFFLAGKVPLLACRLSAGVVELMLDSLSPYLPEGYQYSSMPEVKQAIVQRIMLVFLSPLYMAAKLQQLGLVHDWREPFNAQIFALRSFYKSIRAVGPSGITSCLARSPLLLAILFLPLYEDLDRKLYTYFKAVFARPDNPSTMSYKLESHDHDFDSTDAPVFTLPDIQPSLREELSKDYHAAFAALGVLKDYLTSFVTNASEPNDGTSSKRRNSEGNNQVVTFASGEPDEDSSLLLDSTTSGIEEHTPQTPTHSASPPQSPRSSASDPLSDVDPSAVQVRTRSGSTSTLHMDLEVHLPVAAQERADRRASNADSATANGNRADSKASRSRTRTQHRVTALTILPADELANLFSGLCTSVIMLPLESMFLRLAAQRFLESSPSAPTWLSRSIYEPTGLGLGKYGWKGLVSYSAQIALCFGVETLISLGTWRLGSWFVLWFGKKKFGWGSL